MQVIATAGHVDHGKSTLVRALTGMEPDRWAEERRRGMTIDLGFAWTTIGAQTVAFVDVPGHERFVTTMLAGIGPVPVAMIVVAADEGWMPQSAEHLAALNALGVEHGLLVVTRCDLEDPAAATELAREELATTSLADIDAVAVSAVTGQGMPELREALARLVAGLPPGQDGPVRLWVDRSFTIKGSGTVVTGTLAAGVLATNDELDLTGSLKRTGQTVRVRGLQSLGAPAGEVRAPARVAVNLRGIGKETVSRGAALLTPGRFLMTDLVDVRVHGDPVAGLPAALTLHLGSAAVPVRVRPLGPDTARLRLSHALPLRLGDRALLRDPGRHHVAGGVTVLDVVPPGLTRRGAAAARALVLDALDGTPDVAGELRRRRLIRRSELARMGVDATGSPVAGEWLADPVHWAQLGDRLREEVERYAKENPLEPGAPVEALRHRLGLPDRALVEALVRPPLETRGGRISTAGTAVPDELVATVETAFEKLGQFAAPEANRLTELGLGPRQLAAAVRAGLVVQVAPGVVLRAGSPGRAVRVLAGLAQPFTLSQARQALDTTRRVAVPLLGLLDGMGATQRHDDDRRTVTATG